jgi:hypothetical protein
MTTPTYLSHLVAGVVVVVVAVVNMVVKIREINWKFFPGSLPASRSVVQKRLDSWRKESLGLACWQK